MTATFFHGHCWETAAPGGVALYSAVEYRSTHHYLSGRISHPMWALDYAIDGGLCCRVGSAGAAWQVRPGGLAHLYPPGTPYWEDTRCMKGMLHGAYICFWGGESAGLRRFTDNPSHYARLLDPQHQLAALLQEAAGIAQRRGQAGYWQAQATLCRIIDLLLGADHLEADTWRLSPHDPGAGEPNLAARVQAYLRAHIDRPVALADIARAMQVSQSTLTHRYRQLTGETPLTTHTHLRIEQVKQCLLLGQPLATIAGQLGFCDVYHLSKTFKRVAGLSPRTFLHAAQEPSSTA